MTSLALRLSSPRSEIHFAWRDSESASAGVFSLPPVTSPVMTNLYQEPPRHKIKSDFRFSFYYNLSSNQRCISISKEKTVHTVLLTFSSPYVNSNLLHWLCIFTICSCYNRPYLRRYQWINLPRAVRKAELILCGPSPRLKKYKKYWWRKRKEKPKKWSLFDIVRIYSSRAKTTYKVRKAPMETTNLNTPVKWSKTKLGNLQKNNKESK